MRSLVALSLAALLLEGALVSLAHGETPPDFRRDIRPILADKCFRCHGPDAAQRQAGLRLDRRESAIGLTESGAAAIVPRQPDKSELIARVTSPDPNVRMPPPEAKKPLSPAEIESLQRWIAAGAEYAPHWAFVGPSRPETPEIQLPGDPGGVPIRNEIDAFVADRLRRAGATMAAEAARETLIRRLSLDLTGLPPSIQDVEAFLADASPDAYERLVDRLLASPHYGEKMAQDWLDLARFGDTNGYQDDALRPSYPYRDRVIAAFNDNQPFDQFTIEQLAGDLLPNPTIAQQVASGFNRHHRQNEEGGSDPEEFRVIYAVDRTNTVGTTWMGLTVGCAQCHDHKYDPISQREYYQLYAFFNSLKDEVPISTKDPNSIPPQIYVPSPGDQTRMEQLAEKWSAWEAERGAKVAATEPAFLEWLAAARNQTGPVVTREAKGVVGGVVGRSDVRSYFADKQPGGRLSLDEELKASGRVVVSSSINNNVHIGHLQSTGAGRSNLLGMLVAEGPRLFAYLGLSDGSFAMSEPLPIEHGVEYAWSYAWQPTGGEDDPADEDALGEGLLRVEVRRNGNRLPPLEVYATSDHRALGAGFDAFGIVTSSPGSGEPIELYFDDLEYTVVGGALRRQTFDRDPGWEGLLNRENDRQFGYRPDVALTSLNQETAAIVRLLAIPNDQLSDLDRGRLREFYASNFDTDVRAIDDALATMEAERKAIERRSPQALVFAEMEERRQAFVLDRGDFERPKEQVQPGVPAMFPPLPDGAAANRLALAQWLVNPQHPLTARVAVNRLWKQLFGVGLVKTGGDFGTQGEPPSHPELLDWLAVQFIEDGWDVKKFIKRAVMSATYRQTSQAPRDAYLADPENRLLARGSRFRISAEEIRDGRFAASGLLTRQIGGPSAFPYQPADYFGDKSSDWSWPDKDDDSLYRRGIYTFWRRTTMYPSFQAFDAPPRGECTVSRSRTNTPLQALVTLNDPVYVEAARVLAQRMMEQGGDTPADRATFGFRRALARRPTPAELTALERLFADRLRRYRANAIAAETTLAAGKAPRPAHLDAAELAAWTSVAATLLNLDEFITRE